MEIANEIRSLEEEFKNNKLSKKYFEKFQKIVLVGAGKLGKGVGDFLLSKCNCNIIFCDNNKIGDFIEDKLVISIDEAVGKYRGEALFIITIFDVFLWGKKIDPRTELINRGCGNVVYYQKLFFCYGKNNFERFAPIDWLLSPSELLLEKGEILRAYELFDEDSKKIFINILKSRFFSNNGWENLYLQEYPHFDESVLPILDDEIFVDCGGFDGDTLEEFLKQSNKKFERYFFVEPMKDNIKKIYDKGIYVEIKDKVNIIPYAVSDKIEKINFEYNGGASCATDCKDETLTEEVTSVILDNCLKNERITWIKMDIEGAEFKALCGSKKIIQIYSPKLSISVYHRSNDLWRIPNYIKSINNNYKYYLRLHSSGDIICYAIPYLYNKEK